MVQFVFRRLKLVAVLKFGMLEVMSVSVILPGILHLTGQFLPLLCMHFSILAYFPVCKLYLFLSFILFGAGNMTCYFLTLGWGVKKCKWGQKSSSRLVKWLLKMIPVCWIVFLKHPGALGSHVRFWAPTLTELNANEAAQVVSKRAIPRLTHITPTHTRQHTRTRPQHPVWDGGSNPHR
jgi:hypothetical protein